MAIQQTWPHCDRRCRFEQQPRSKDESCVFVEEQLGCGMWKKALLLQGVCIALAIALPAGSQGDAKGIPSTCHRVASNDAQLKCSRSTLEVQLLFTVSLKNY